MSFGKELVKSIPWNSLMSLKEQVYPIHTEVAESPIRSEKSKAHNSGLGLLPLMCACVIKEIYTHGLAYALNTSGKKSKEIENTGCF